MRFKLWFAAGLVIGLAGCGRGGGDSGGGGRGGENPTPVIPVTGDGCPVSQLSADQIRELVFRVKAVVGVPDDIGMVMELRAGMLASELSKLGVPDMVILQSIKNGKFAALASWLGYNPVVDFNKFSKCEEN